MKKTKTQAFANLIGSLIFIALGAWALTQTYSFQEVKNTYVQAAVFPQIMCVGMLIFAIILLIQSIIKLMTMDENDPLAEPAASINFIKDRGVLAALFVMRCACCSLRSLNRWATSFAARCSALSLWC